MKHDRARRRTTLGSVLFFLLALATALPPSAAAQEATTPYKRFPDEESYHQWGRDRQFDLIHTRVEIVPDFETLSIRGTSTIRFRPLAAGLERVQIDAVEIDVDRVVLEGRKLEFTYVDQGISIELGASYGPDQELEISIDYACTPRAGLFFVVPDKGYPHKPRQIWTQGETEWNRYWFPCYDYPNDMGTSEVIVTVPGDFYAISNGTLRERKENGDGTVTYHWYESVPHVTYLIALAVGEFEVVEDSADGLPLQYVVRKADLDKAERSFGKTPDMIRLFNEKVGVKYPYEKYAQVCTYDFIWGGMENASCTFVTDRTLHDERAEPDYTSLGLVAHELAHQWFGDYLTCKDWADIWLNESFATYFGAIYFENEVSVDEFRYRMLASADSYKKEDRTEYRRPIVTHLYTHQGDLFDSHAYPKGAWVLHMIRYLLGDDLWWKAIHAYVDTYKLQSVETNDFRETLERVSGKDFEGFFHQWLSMGGHPAYQTSWEWNPDDKLVVFTVAQTQPVDDLTPLFDMPVEIGLYGKDWQKTFTVRVNKAEHEFVFPAKTKPHMVLFDVGNRILKDLKEKKHSREWRYQLTHAEDIVARIQAAQGLARKSASTRNLDALETALLHDSFYGVRGEVATTLGKLGGPRSKALLQHALNDEKSTVRRKAARALVKFEEDPEVFDWLVEAVQKDESYAVRADALWAVAKGDFDGAFGVLKKALGQDSHNEVVRSAALEGFAALEDEKGVELCKKYATYGNRREVRSAAVGALASLGKDLSDQKEKKKIRRFLEQQLAIDRQYLHVQRALVTALGDLGDAEAIPALELAKQNAIERRYVVAIEKAIAKLQAPAPAQEGDLEALKSQVAGLEKENRSLEKRLDRLESNLEEAQAAAKAAGAAEDSVSDTP